MATRPSSEPCTSARSPSLGHTARSAAYLVDGVLFVGDSADADKKSGALVPAVWLFSDDPAQNRRSLMALAKTVEPMAAQIKWMAPAHSGPMEGTAALTHFAAANR